MSAYVVKASYATVDEDGAPIVIPRGARVEEGNFYLTQSPDLWELEGEPKLFEPRRYVGLTVFPTGVSGESPVTVDLATGKPVEGEQYTAEEWQAWLEAESVEAERLAAEKAKRAQANRPQRPTSGGVKRSLPQPKK